MRAVVLLLLSMTHSAVSAQGSAGEEAARAYFERGTHLFETGELEDALEAFRESYAIRPVPVVLFNIAQTLRSLGRRGESIKALERFLEQNGSLEDAQRESLLRTLDALRAEVGQAQVDVNVRGAELAVGARSLGASPLEGVVYLDPGPHRFRATLGEHEVATNLVVRAGETYQVALTFPEDAYSAPVRIDANVPGATVAIDAEARGAVPLALRLPAGAHRAEVEAPGFVPWSRPLPVEAGVPLDLHADLEYEPRVRDSPWLWAGLAGAVVVAVGLTLAVTLRPQDPQPIAGSAGVVQALAESP